MRVIYEPKGRAREYAALAANFYEGCGLHCVYCYVPRNARAVPYPSVPKARPNIIPALRQDAHSLYRRGVKGQVLLSFSTDPYQPLDDECELTRQAIQVLHEFGLGVQTLTKGGTRALRDLELFGQGDAYAATLTFLDARRARVWEPGGAAPDDRLEALRRFHERGVPTWVSLEPVLDPDETLAIIRATRPFVDLFRVGKLNYPERVPSQ